MKVFCLSLAISVLFSPVADAQQWGGSTDQTNAIYRNGNIAVNGLNSGRYGAAISGDANPYMISTADNESHDLLLFGSGALSTLHLRLCDGDLKLGYNATPTTTILYNNGNASFGGTVSVNGNLGIGTLPSLAKLDINQSGGESGQHLALKVRAGNSQNYFGNTQLSFSYAGGSGYSHAIKTRHNSGSISGNAFDCYVWQPADGIDAEGSLNVMTLNGDKVGIGTPSPNKKLTVNGTIYGKEVKVDLNVPAPDYVFKKDYDLASLEEIKAHIDQHGHLPEVPSAGKMAENGVELGVMNMLLLKKIEELTFAPHKIGG